MTVPGARWIECEDCGSRASETLFPQVAQRRSANKPRLCVDCTAERARVAQRDALPKKVTQTRASYRAALRRRQKSAQMDLVDQLVKAP